MPACEKCGANLTPQTAKCPYCNTVTPYGVQEAAARQQYDAANQWRAAQHAQASAAQAQFLAQSEVQRSADQAFLWAAIGVAVCCIPIFSIIGIVFGFRARSLAMSRNLPVPGKAWAAIVMGFSSFVLLGGLVLIAQKADAEREAHKADLKKHIGSHAEDKSLAPNIACDLAELYLIDNDLHGSKISDGSVNCDAASFQITDDKATMTGAHIKFSEAGKEEEANLCFKHGQKWVVDAVVQGMTCEDKWSGKKAADADGDDSEKRSPGAPAPGDPLGPNVKPDKTAAPTSKPRR